MKLKLEDIKKVLILGSGTLGLRVGLQSAISGFETTIYDINEESMESAKQIQQKILSGLVKKALLTNKQAEDATARISWTSDAEVAAKDADFVNESVTENLGIKQKVWEQFGKLCPSHTLLTTNTSYLLPSMFAKDTGRPGQFCAFHFHDVFLANVVDIMPHPGTEAWVIDFLQDMGKRLNQTPVVMTKENPGYIFNSMLMAVLGAAGALVTKDVASIEDVDRSWIGNFKMEIGPFGIMDSIGLDTAWHVIKSRSDEKSKRFAALLKTYLDEGKLGVKTGEGFYKYPHPKFKQPGFVQGNAQAETVQ